jgi:hypothetical protein
MANTMRWRYGETNPVMMPVFEDDSIEIGDLVWRDGNLARPASMMILSGELPQDAFKPEFLGVSMQCSAVGSKESVRIATTGVFEFDLPTEQSFDVGDLMCPSVSLDVLHNQMVSRAQSHDQAIGRCVKFVRMSTKVLVDIVSTVCKGGVMRPQVKA